jgi:tetratricopeptide (TPR) repeat protein
MFRSGKWVSPVAVLMLRFAFAGALLASGVYAQEEAKEALKSTPTVTPSLTSGGDTLAEAGKFYREGHFDAAIQKYQQILSENHNSAEGYAGLTRVYLKQKNLQHANDTISQGVQVADGPATRVALGEVYFRQGKIPEAEHEWVKVINSGHADARAYLGLARVDRALSLYKKSKDMVDKAHRLDPDDPDIQRFWADTLSRKERIKNLEEYLANIKNDDANTREHLQHYLEYLKERQQGPSRSCKLLGNVTSTETKLVPLLRDATHMRGLGLSVSVNGTKATLMLDTGASGILIDRGIAEKSGLARLSEITVWGFGDKGENAGWVGLANSIKIGELEFQNCPVRVMDKRSVVDQDGLIGADVFERFLVDINLPDRKLRLSELPKRPGETGNVIKLKADRDDAESEETTHDTTDATSKPAPTPPPTGPFDAYVDSEMKSYSKVFRFGHDLLVPTRIGDAPNKLFLLDTGSLANMIDPKAASEVTKVHGDSNTTVKGISGSVKNVYSADGVVLTFGHITQENQDIISFDFSTTSDSAGTEISGTLGFVTLNLLDLKIDYRDGLVDFSYDPNRFH